MFENLKENTELAVFAILFFMGFLVLFFSIERLIFFYRLDLNKYAKRQLLDIDLTKNMIFISSIGANAPYVGLLGTVLAIMATFYDISHGSLVDTKQIMLGLALALKATALGLVVAIPSMIIYNLLSRKAEVLLSMWDARH